MLIAGVGNVFRGGAMYEYVLASRGWAVLSLNPSGSGSYGREFMQTLRGRWGELDLPEHHALENGRRAVLVSVDCEARDL